MASDLPDPVAVTATAGNVGEVRELLASLPPLPAGWVWSLAVEAAGEVVCPPHAEECLAAHPGEPCPGYPHEV